MLIKFTDKDPRAGTVARMDSARGQQLVDAGAATRLKENGTEVDDGANVTRIAGAPAATPAPAPAPTPAPTPAPAPAPASRKTAEAEPVVSARRRRK